MRHTGAVRIALVHYTSAPVVAGVELVMAAHSQLLTAAGHDVTIVANRTEEGVPAFQAALRPVLATKDIVILHNVATMHFNLPLTEALSELAGELDAVRFIAWVHDLAAGNADYAPLPSAAWELIARANPRYEYVAVSELRRRQFAKLTGEDRCRVIPNGVEPAEVLGLPPPFADFARDVVLFHPTRVLRRKNIELTLRVTAAIQAAGCSCACLITAPPDVQNTASSTYAQELRALQHELALGTDAIFLHDHAAVGPGEMRALFSLADALFFPSRQEGFGLPLLEAALHRLPIFCSDIEPLNSLLGHDVTTFPLEAIPAEIATLILQTLAANPAQRARRQTLQSYTWSAIYRNYLAPLLAETNTQPRL